MNGALAACDAALLADTWTRIARCARKLVKVARPSLRSAGGGRKAWSHNKSARGGRSLFMASIDDSRTGMRNQSGIADLIVKGAIALVTAAFFIGAYLQFQVTFWLALIAALSVYITLLMLHALMRRSERVDALVSEVTRLEDELARLQAGRRRQAADTGRHRPHGCRSAAARRAMPAARLLPPPAAPVADSSAVAACSAATAVRRSAPERASRPCRARAAAAHAQRMRRRRRPSLRRGAAPTLSIRSCAGGSRQPELSPWPRSAGSGASQHARLLGLPPGQAVAARDPAQRAARPAPPPAAEREADLDAVQGMIKRLADEVSLGGDGLLERAPPPRQESALRASLDALQTTASTMRAARNEGACRSPAPARTASRRSDAAADRAGARAPVVARRCRRRRPHGCRARQPIVGLADHQVHYYEVDRVCPRDERGMPSARRRPRSAACAHRAASAARQRAPEAQAAQVCRSFAEQGQKYCVFAAASGESLATDRFLDELADAYREREALAGELVLTFAQADVRTFGGIGVERAHRHARSGLPLRPRGRDRLRLRVHGAARGGLCLRQARRGDAAAWACRAATASCRPPRSAGTLRELGLDAHRRRHRRRGDARQGAWRAGVLARPGAAVRAAAVGSPADGFAAADHAAA